MSPALSSALSGIQAAETQLNRSAGHFAFLPSASGNPSDTVDLGSEMIALINARNNTATNVKVAQTADQMDGSLLDMLG